MPQGFERVEFVDTSTLIRGDSIQLVSAADQSTERSFGMDVIYVNRRFAFAAAFVTDNRNGELLVNERLSSQYVRINREIGIRAGEDLAVDVYPTPTNLSELPYIDDITEKMWEPKTIGCAVLELSRLSREEPKP